MFALASAAAGAFLPEVGRGLARHQGHHPLVRGQEEAGPPLGHPGPAEEVAERRRHRVNGPLGTHGLGGEGLESESKRHLEKSKDFHSKPLQNLRGDKYFQQKHARLVAIFGQKNMALLEQTQNVLFSAVVI